MIQIPQIAGIEIDPGDWANNSSEYSDVDVVSAGRESRIERPIESN